MGVPFETLLPYGVMIALFSVTGVGFAGMEYIRNSGKRPRRGLDKWDRQMMQRDQRITGAFRAQSDQVKAPAGFEVTNPWHAEPRIS